MITCVPDSLNTFDGEYVTVAFSGTPFTSIECSNPSYITVALSNDNPSNSFSAQEVNEKITLIKSATKQNSVNDFTFFMVVSPVLILFLFFLPFCYKNKKERQPRSTL